MCMLVTGVFLCYIYNFLLHRKTQKRKKKKVRSKLNRILHHPENWQRYRLVLFDSIDVGHMLLLFALFYSIDVGYMYLLHCLFYSIAVGCILSRTSKFHCDRLHVSLILSVIFR